MTVIYINEQMDYILKLNREFFSSFEAVSVESHEFWGFQYASQ